MHGINLKDLSINHKRIITCS